MGPLLASGLGQKRLKGRDKIAPSGTIDRVVLEAIVTTHPHQRHALQQAQMPRRRRLRDAQRGDQAILSVLAGLKQGQDVQARFVRQGF